MMRVVIALFLGLLATPVLAQQPPPDPQIMVYRQLLDNANAQLAQVAAELQRAQTRVKELEDRYEKKPPPPSGAK